MYAAAGAAAGGDVVLPLLPLPLALPPPLRVPQQQPPRPLRPLMCLGTCLSCTDPMLADAVNGAGDGGADSGSGEPPPVRGPPICSEVSGLNGWSSDLPMPLAEMLGRRPATRSTGRSPRGLEMPDASGLPGAALRLSASGTSGALGYVS